MTPQRGGPVRWLSRLGLRRPRPEESVEWEIEHHIAELVDRLTAEGWEEHEARREAERRFGERARYGPSMQRFERRRMAMERRTRILDAMADGVSAFVRTARRYPAFTLGVVVTLALGIGANATMYGIVDRLLLQPPAHIAAHGDVRRVFVERPSVFTQETYVQASQAFPDYLDWKGHAGFSGLAAFTPSREETVGSGEGATRARVALATHDFFSVLGVSARMGRFFAEAEDRPGAPLTAVISEEYWEQAYGADPSVLGRTLDLSGHGHTIVGVAPRGFTGVELEATDIWLPLQSTHVARSGEEHCLEERNCWWFQVVGRLAPGVPPEAVESEATRIHINGRRELIEADDYPADARVVLGSLIAAQGPNASAETRVARWLTAVSMIVLLIACANVANLLLARGTKQRKEIAVRLALGVSQGRVVTQMMLESMLVRLVGGGLALLLARWGGGFVRSALLPGVYFPDSAVNARVLVFTLVASALAGLVAGVGPALQSSRTEIAGELVDVSRGSSGARSRLRSFLTVLQATLSVVLLVGAGLFIRSLGEVRSLDLGVDVDRVLLTDLEFVDPELAADVRTERYREARRLVTELPSVDAAAATTAPFGWSYAQRLIVPGWDSLPRLAGGGPYYAGITPGYFATMGLELTSGRDFDDADREGAAKVAIVSETMARTIWPDRAAVGACMYVGEEAQECTTVVGIAEDATRNGYEDEPHMAYYLPLDQLGRPPEGLYVRVANDAGTAAAEVAPLLRSFAPGVRFANVESLREWLDPQARSWTLGAAMFSVFGALALVLAAIGLYSVLAFDIAQRTRELGIRTALGAERSRLLTKVVAQGTRLAAAGILGGTLIAYVAAPYAADLLFQVSPRDPVVLVGVAATLLLVGSVASLVPGLRASRVDPMVALRSE